MSTASEKLNALFARWKEEHRVLDTYVAELCEWFHRPVETSSPPVEQAIVRLGELRKQLEAHFVKEMELGRLLAEARGTVTMEIDSMRHKHDREHANLLERLGQLIARLDTTEPQFDQWEAITRDFELFVDTLEQHEEQEAASIGWLAV